MKLIYYGHSCFEVLLKDATLLFDPFISGNPMAGDLDPRSLKPDYILLTHGHNDHIQDVEPIAKHTGAKIISNFEIVSYYSKMDIEGHALNHGGGWDFEFGRVKYVNAIHSSSTADGTYMGNPGGFVLETGEGNFYNAGDTALTMDMKIIPMTSGKLDFCILPIGDNFTMNVDDALIASDWLECDKIVGCHFDTFPYIEIDHEEALAKFEKKGKTLILPEIGKEVRI